jgi:hypothetical protein
MTSSAANMEEHFSLETGLCHRCRRTVRGKRNAFGGSTCFDLPLNIPNEVANGVCLACYGHPSRSQLLVNQRPRDPCYKSQIQRGARRQSMPTQHEHILHQSGDSRRQSLPYQREHIYQHGGSSDRGDSPAIRSVDGRGRRGEESSYFQSTHSARGATQQSSCRAMQSQVAEYTLSHVAEDRNRRMQMVESDFAAASSQCQNSEGKKGGYAGGLTILESLLLKHKTHHGKSAKHSLKKCLGLPSKKQHSSADRTLWTLNLSQNNDDGDVSVLGMEGW